MKTLFSCRDFRRTQKYAYKIYKLEKICNRCWSTEARICVHHIDENPCNDSLENFEILCFSCHNIHHFKWKKLTKKHRENISKAWIWRKARNKWISPNKQTLEKRSKTLKWKIPWNKGLLISQNNKLFIDWLSIKQWREKTWKSARQFYKLAK